MSFLLRHDKKAVILMPAVLQGDLEKAKWSVIKILG